MAALAGQVGQHARLGVLVFLELEQVVAAPRAVQRGAPVQHESLSARAHRAPQQGLQGRIRGHAPLRHGLHPGQAQALHQLGALGRQGSGNCSHGFETSMRIALHR